MTEQSKPVEPVEATPEVVQGGVSIIIRHKVSPKNQGAYESWLKLIIPASAKFPGHQGVHILRPHAGGHEFEISVRFASEKEAHDWLNSAQRKTLLEQSKPLFHEQEITEIYNGIDFWFTQRSAAQKIATRWKQWLITTVVIWPLTMLVPLLLQPVFNNLPFSINAILHQGVVVAIVVALVVYVIMPRLVKLVASWLFKSEA
ncbi:antibiotic biosynthesis monooxygenase [Paraglaciecola sp.]|uniref:antibiotic biosynthesis monooxygenase n=1 Tax=Paraglaciecola sp. TaxID=1920173 RepID=UPI0030F3934F